MYNGEGGRTGKRESWKEELKGRRREEERG